MASVQRPLSPHLTVYKPQITSMLSIFHRGTGVYLSVVALFLSCWLLSIATGAQAYELIQGYLLTWYGQILIIGSVFSFYYHFCNGIRHLFWDIGMGLEIESAYQSGYAVIITSVVLTIVTCLLGMGGAA